MKTLLHMCCGPCATYCYKTLKEEGHNVYGYFYNPNIHPLVEYRKRKESAYDFAEKVGLQLIGTSEYGLTEFIQNVAFREANRCFICYNMRLLQTAKLAKKGGFEAFTTTLLISPFQNHESIIEVGKAIEAETGVKFMYRDFRKGFKQSVQLSKELNLYRQQYCGCIYSEEERYKNQKKV